MASNLVTTCTLTALHATLCRLANTAHIDFTQFLFIVLKLELKECTSFALPYPLVAGNRESDQIMFGASSFLNILNSSVPPLEYGLTKP